MLYTALKRRVVDPYWRDVWLGNLPVRIQRTQQRTQVSSEVRVGVNSNAIFTFRLIDRPRKYYNVALQSVTLLARLCVSV